MLWAAQTVNDWHKVKTNQIRAILFKKNELSHFMKHIRELAKNQKKDKKGAF